MLEPEVAQVASDNVQWKKSPWLPLCMCQFTYSFTSSPLFSSALLLKATLTTHLRHPYAVLTYPVCFAACSRITVRQLSVVSRLRLLTVTPLRRLHRVSYPLLQPTTSSPSPLTLCVAIHPQISPLLPTYPTRCVSSTSDSQTPTRAFCCWS
jgi:hypothetical protein